MGCDVFRVKVVTYTNGVRTEKEVRSFSSFASGVSIPRFLITVVLSSLSIGWAG
jgi:hypothetical protein